MGLGVRRESIVDQGLEDRIEVASALSSVDQVLLPHLTTCLRWAHELLEQIAFVALLEILGFLNSPGIGSVVTHGVKVTRPWLPQAVRNQHIVAPNVLEGGTNMICTSGWFPFQSLLQRMDPFSVGFGLELVEPIEWLSAGYRSLPSVEHRVPPLGCYAQLLPTVVVAVRRQEGTGVQKFSAPCFILHHLRPTLPRSTTSTFPTPHS